MKTLMVLLLLILFLIPCYASADVGPSYNESNGYEHCDSTFCYGKHYKGQQFTTGEEAFIVRSISLYGKLGGGSPDKVIVSIYGVRENGVPTGKALTTSGEIDCSEWSTSFEWHMFDVVHYELAPNTMYAIVIKNVRGNSDNFIRLSFSNKPTYEGGSVVRSPDGGFKWIVNQNADLAFVLQDINSLPNNEDPVLSTPTPYSSSNGDSGVIVWWIVILLFGIIVSTFIIFKTKRKRTQLPSEMPRRKK